MRLSIPQQSLIGGLLTKDTNQTNKHERNKSMTDKTNLLHKDLLHKDLSYKVVGCIYEVRKLYGSGNKELVYQNALAEILTMHGMAFNREVDVNIRSELSGKRLGTYRLDFVIEEAIILEIKAIKFTPDKMEQQLYGYLKSTIYEVGYLVNFGSTELYMKRIILTNDRKLHPFDS